MATKSVDILRLMSASVFCANQAGKIVRDVMKRGDLKIVDKGVNDLQTEADRSAQRCIVNSLLKLFPNVPIIGEETLDDVESNQDELWGFEESVLKLNCPKEFESLNPEDIVVWVDPLDGTSEYTQGLLDHVTVLIGIAVNGKAVGGVIHQPFYNYQLGRTIWGLEKCGLYGIEALKPPTDKLIVTTTRSHGNKTINAAIEAVSPTDVVRVGGAGHKVLLVIEGKAHAYVFASSGCKKWDTCAPEAVLRAAGGKLTDMFGNDIPYDRNVDLVNRTGVLAASDESSHKLCISRIPTDVLANLMPAAL